MPRWPGNGHSFPFGFSPAVGNGVSLSPSPVAVDRSRAAEQFQVLAVSTSVRVASSSYALSISDLQSSQALDLNVARRNAWPSAIQQYCLQSRQSCFVQTNWQLSCLLSCHIGVVFVQELLVKYMCRYIFWGCLVGEKVWVWLL